MTNRNGKLYHFVDKVRNSYLDCLESGDMVKASACVKAMENYQFDGVLQIKDLNLDNLLFFASFNKYVIDNPDVNEYVAKKVLTKQKANLHMLTSFMAYSGAVDNLAYDQVYLLIKLLCELEEQELGYCFEVKALKKLQTNLDAYTQECLNLFQELGSFEELIQAKELQRLVKYAIHTAVIKKANYLGLYILK